MSRDESTLLDIRKAGQWVRDFIQGMDKPAFLKDVKTQSAVLHQLLTIGEAVKRLSEDFRTAHPTIPWSLIAGMRDILIHQYETVDLDEVWKTLDKDIPMLLAFVNSLLPAEQ